MSAIIPCMCLACPLLYAMAVSDGNIIIISYQMHTLKISEVSYLTIKLYTTHAPLLLPFSPFLHHEACILASGCWWMYKYPCTSVVWHHLGVLNKGAYSELMILKHGVATYALGCFVGKHWYYYTEQLWCSSYKWRKCSSFSLSIHKQEEARLVCCSLLRYKWVHLATRIADMSKIGLEQSELYLGRL